MLRFAEFQEVQKTATGRSKSTPIMLSIDQVVAVRPTQHYKETSITLTSGSVLVEGSAAEVLQMLQAAAGGAAPH